MALEAEYIACSEATREARWLIQLHKDVTGQTIQPTIYCDNQGVLKTLESGGIQTRTKHLDIRYHNSHSLHTMGILHSAYIHTSQNIIDLLTKALSVDKYRGFFGFTFTLIFVSVILLANFFILYIFIGLEYLS